MKTPSIASLTAALSIVGLATLVSPTQARPTVSPGISKQVVVAKPDLHCKISVWEDQAMTMPVTNGGSLGYGGGAPSLFAQVIVTNKGAGDAGPAATSVEFKRGASVLESHADTLAIPAGLSKIYPTFEIGLPGITNEVRIDVALDKDGAVAESSELNNTCTFTKTVTVVH